MKWGKSFEFLLFWALTMASGKGFAQSGAQVDMSDQASINEANENDGIPAGAVFGPVFYKVKKGETIESISAKFGISVEQFQRWNFLPDGLSPGTKVAVKFSWNKPAKAEEPVKKEEALTASRVQYHQVEPNETLYHLSVVYNVTVDELKEWNNLDDNKIRIHQKLIVRK